MLHWEWETFAQICNSGELHIDDPGPLHHPIRLVSIERDSRLSLRMTTHASEAATGLGNPQHALGTVSVVADSASFANTRGLWMRTEGLQIEKTAIQENMFEPGRIVQSSHVASLKGGFTHVSGTTSYVIDWLGNLDPRFKWPDTMVDRGQTIRTREIGSSEPRLTITYQLNPNAEDFHWNCARLHLGGQNLFLCTIPASMRLTHIRPGFLLYLGDPPEDTRSRIRECVHFMLGLFPVYLGSSQFDGEWNLKSFEAVSAYSMNGRAFELPPVPPSPLGTKWLWEVDRRLLSNAANALYQSYDDLNFGVVSWAYWHAVAAAPHIAGVHYGAAIESLERAYLKSKGGAIETKLLSESTWQSLRRSLQSALAQANLDYATKQVFDNRIDGLNQSPQSKRIGALLTNLKLKVGESERRANRIRNTSAHGKDDNIDVEWIRELKVLRVHLHRLVLAMSGASDQYYDYFTLDHPVRSISEAIP